MSAMDVASLPQSVDGVGAFRYTTKLSEYASAGLPVVTGRLPFSYDLDAGWLWRLPGDAPWSPRYVQALGRLMEEERPGRHCCARGEDRVPLVGTSTAREQQTRVSAFVADLIEGHDPQPP